MNRSRDYYREVRKKHINRKKKMDKVLMGTSYFIPFYSCDGRYSKGKIHCSCPLCRSKTKTEGYKPADIRKIEKANYDETKEKEYDRFSEGYNDELADVAAVAPGVTLDGIPLDGHSLWDSLFKDWD